MTTDKDPAAKEFGRLVRERRKALGWSQEALAAEALSNSTRKNHISQIENGKVPNITQDTVKKVAQALKIDLEEIPPALRWPEASEVVKDTNTVAHEIQTQVNKLVAFQQDRAREFAVKENMLIALANRYAEGSPNDFEAALKELDRALELLEPADHLPADGAEACISLSSPKKIDVMIINAGGVIGSMPNDPEDPASPQILLDRDSFLKRTPELREENLGYNLGFEKLSESFEGNGTGPHQWIETVKIIERNYDDCEGFVILHDIDTMVHAASALSFMLVNLGKPVVLTGANSSHLFQVRNDGLLNLITALAVANPKASGISVIPEVMIAFASELLRGNRVRRRDANGYTAYETPKYPPLARIGTDITVDESRILPMPDSAFFVRKNLELNVIDFNVFPGVVHNGIADVLFDSKDFKPKGAVVRAYGAGNIPTDDKFLARLTKATQNHNVTLINVTQCTQGRVELGLYETSNMLLALGMVSGTDLTPEAALMKMMVALADEDMQNDKVALRNFLQTNQTGEQSTSIYEIPFQTSANRLSPESPYMTIKTDRLLPGSLVPSEIEHAHLRLYGVMASDTKKHVPEDDESGFFEVEVYAKISPPERFNRNSSSSFLGRFRRTATENAPVLIHDIPDVTRRSFRPGQCPSFTLRLASARGEVVWKRAELALFVKQ